AQLKGIQITISISRIFVAMAAGCQRLLSPEIAPLSPPPLISYKPQHIRHYIDTYQCNAPEDFSGNRCPGANGVRDPRQLLETVLRITVGRCGSAFLILRAIAYQSPNSIWAKLTTPLMSFRTRAVAL